MLRRPIGRMIRGSDVLTGRLVQFCGCRPHSFPRPFRRHTDCIGVPCSTGRQRVHSRRQRPTAHKTRMMLQSLRPVGRGAARLPGPSGSAACTVPKRQASRPKRPSESGSLARSARCGHPAPSNRQGLAQASAAGQSLKRPKQRSPHMARGRAGGTLCMPCTRVRRSCTQALRFFLRMKVYY
jgi:hypothetical protein